MLSPSSSANDDEDVFTYQIEVLFPNITEDKIRTVEFLDAARGLVRIIGMHLVSSKYHITYTKTKSIKTNTNVSEKLGKVFAPVKHDIQGNIDVSTYLKMRSFTRIIIYTPKNNSRNSRPGMQRIKKKTRFYKI